MSDTLYNKYRPTSLKTVVGCKKAKAILTKYTPATLPHTLLFTGPTGCGKTTLARLVARGMLKVHATAFHEMNAADDTGIDAIRRILLEAQMAPLNGKCKFYHLDECHMLSTNAQEGLLKLLEEPPPFTWVACSTTDPQKLKPTFKNRCTVVPVELAKPADLTALIKRVAEAEGIKLTKSVGERLIESSEGSPRQCLTLLDTIAGMADTADQMAALETPTQHRGVYDLWMALLKKQWPAARKALLNLADEDAEGIRWALLTMTKNAMLKSDKKQPQHYKIIVSMSDPFFNTKHAGLAAAVYEAVN